MKPLLVVDGYNVIGAWSDVSKKEWSIDEARDQLIHILQDFSGYADEEVAPWKEVIRAILEKRQINAVDDWKALGEKMSGQEIIPFDADRYKEEYVKAPENDKDETFLGKFVLAALAQKAMVTNKIYTSGNKLAGVSIDQGSGGLFGNKDFRKLIDRRPKK